MSGMEIYKGESFPLVSVIIPTFKRPDTLTRAVDSVLSQTYKNVEVIVVDDNNPGSEGRKLTEDVMKVYEGNERVIYIKHPQNKNGSAARNTGAKASKGKYIAFLDDDDEFLPLKIESQVERLENLPVDWGLCYSKHYSRKPGGEPIEAPECREGRLYLNALQRTLGFAAGSNLLIRKEAFNDVGGFDESFKKSQDLELIAKLLWKYKIAYVETPGLIVNVHLEKRVCDFEKQTKDYLERFKPFIEQLSLEEQKSVYVEINKQRFFNYFRVEHSIKGCLKMLIKKEIKLHDAFDYTFRKIKVYIRRSLGMKLKSE